MKRILSLLLMFFVTFSLCACGGSDAPATYTEASYASPPTVPEETADTTGTDGQNMEEDDLTADLVDRILTGEISIEELDTLIAAEIISLKERDKILAALESRGFYEDIENTEMSNKTENFWDYPALGNTTGNMVITDATSFGEGVAWIRVASPDAWDGHIMLIDTSGKVLYYCYASVESQFIGDVVNFTNFSQGVSLLTINDDAFLIDTSGKIVWQMKKDGIADAETVYGAGSIENAELCTDVDKIFGGYLIVKFDINTFEKAGSVYAFIKPDGTRLTDFTEAKPEYDPGKCYCRYWSDYSSGYYINLLTGETIPDEREWKSRTWYSDAEKYYDAVAMWQKDYERSFQGELLWDEAQKGFTDESGNIIIDCSQYTISSTPLLYNGYCILEVKNPDGAPYITAIDSSGKQIFAPVKKPTDFSNTPGSGYFAEGYFVFSQDDTAQFYQYASPSSKYYFTLAGEAVALEEYVYVSPFSDGYSLAKQYHYSGIYNNTYNFLDKDLNDAFPQSGSAASGNGSGKSYIDMDSFVIEGKWKSIGSYGFGQAQPGAIIAFDGINCNFFSPSDTYAFYKSGDGYVLECTSPMSADTVTFTVKIIDVDNIDIYYGDNITELKRIG